MRQALWGRKNASLFVAGHVIYDSVEWDCARRCLRPWSYQSHQREPSKPNRWESERSRSPPAPSSPGTRLLRPFGVFLLYSLFCRSFLSPAIPVPSPALPLHTAISCWTIPPGRKHRYCTEHLVLLHQPPCLLKHRPHIIWNSKQSLRYYLLTPLLALAALQKPLNCMKGAIYCLT